MTQTKIDKMAFEEGVLLARSIINDSVGKIHLAHFEDDFLQLLIQCSQHEEANEIALPMMLVLHDWKNEKYEKNEKSSDSPLIMQELKKRLRLFRQSCEKEYQSRHPKIVYLNLKSTG